MPKSPFLYPGSKGKKSDLKQIGNLIPIHDEYWEPFVGGGSVLFQCQHAPAGVISDTYSDLITCYKAIQSCPEEMIDLLPKWNPSPKYKQISESSYRSYWADLKNSEPNTLAEQGARFLFLNRTSFQGFGGILKPEFQRYNYDLLSDRIKECSKILSKLTIKAISALDQITCHSDKKVFIFIDPPYLKANNKACYKNNDWNRDRFSEMAGILCKSKHLWLLTIDNDPLVRKLFKDFEIREFSWDKRQVNKKKQKSSELYVFNFEA